MTKRWSDSILAHLDVESVSADLRLAPCLAAAVLWVSGTAWSVKPQNKGFSRTEIMTSCQRSCFTFYFLSKIQHQHSSVSSQLCGWLRNAGQRSLCFCFQPGCCRLSLDCDWTRSIVGKFRQYSGLLHHVEEIISILMLSLVVYFQTKDFKRFWQ